MALFCEYTSLKTESDVEQKLIYPMLTSAPPMGLGLNDLSHEEYAAIEVGDELNCEIIEYSYDHNNFQLKVLHE